MYEKNGNIGNILKDLLLYKGKPALKGGNKNGNKAGTSEKNGNKQV